MNTKKTLARGVLLASLVMVSGLALADRPEWAGRSGDRREHREDDREHERERRDYYRERDRREQEYHREQAKREREHYRDDDRDGRGYYPARPQPNVAVEVRIGGYFGDVQRREAHDYYRDQYRGGHCPPGLAKKNNGCLPPGQARQWGVGQPLPRDVAYYPVEPAVQVRLGRPPAGYEFIRVASDILLIAVGTGMVVDAIQDLGGR